jgi:NTE family protein
MDKKIGIVLSGGAIRGLAHIGVLKALEEKGIKPSIVSGVSAGSIVGAFYCSGYTPDKMKEIALNTNFLHYVKPAIPKKSFFYFNHFDKFLKKYLKTKNIEDLEIPFYACATNLNKGMPEYFNKGSLIDVVKASSSVPILFEPVKIGRYTYVDGGIMNNLPVEPILEKADYIIGVDVNPLESDKNFSNIVSISVRTLFLAFRANIEPRKSLCDLFIQPEKLSDIGLYSIWRVEDAINAGYQAVKNIDIKIV